MQASRYGTPHTTITTTLYTHYTTTRFSLSLYTGLLLLLLSLSVPARSICPSCFSLSLSTLPLSPSLSLRFLSASACCCRPRRTITIITRHYHYTLLHCGYTSLYLLLYIPSSSPSRWFECIFTFTILYCVSIVSRP
jgi:hypothetical protein